MIDNDDTYQIPDFKMYDDEDTDDELQSNLDEPEELNFDHDYDIC